MLRCAQKKFFYAGDWRVFEPAYLLHTKISYKKDFNITSLQNFSTEIRAPE